MVADRIEEAYLRLHPRLWHALVAYCGEPEVASDAESEAFAQALRRGSEIVDLDAWVWRSAFRIAAGLLKSQPLLVDPSADLASHTKTAIPHTQLAEFLSMLGTLSDQQRAVVALRYVGGFRAAEIADLLGTSAGAVRVQLHRAHDHLRKALRLEIAEESDE